MRESERASDIESGGSDGREEGVWDGEKQPKRRLFFFSRCQREKFRRENCMSVYVIYGTLLQLPMIERPPLTCDRYCRNA